MKFPFVPMAEGHHFSLDDELYAAPMTTLEKIKQAFKKRMEG
jgi:hypothetical protein